ncbi:heme-binding domain-containing protein [Nonlabens marinus]|uniref:heme-binding domain-containing protein n=1 Tax=Nonlabens marinus TaxID=930802 RepID=UPI0005A060B9|nr:heme-binding domain-containing protein [Nonlabens marinus]
MKFLKFIAWLALGVLVVIQFFPVTLNESNTLPQSDFMVVNQVPATIKNRLQVSCYDCHSNNTEYPWYSRIQPTAWYLENHIQEGKDELNFNEWDTYSSRRKNSKLRSIINQIESGEMPLDSYTLIHGGARLDSTAVKEIIGYMDSLKKD